MFKVNDGKRWVVERIGDVTATYREGSEKVKFTIKVSEEKKGRLFTRDKEFWLTMSQVEDLRDVAGTVFG